MNWREQLAQWLANRRPPAAREGGEHLDAMRRGWDLLSEKEEDVDRKPEEEDP